MQQFLANWPIWAIPPVAILVFAAGIRLIVQPRVTPETEQERRDWQAW